MIIVCYCLVLKVLVLRFSITISCVTFLLYKFVDKVYLPLKFVYSYADHLRILAFLTTNDRISYNLAKKAGS